MNTLGAIPFNPLPPKAYDKRWIPIWLILEFGWGGVKGKQGWVLKDGWELGCEVSWEKLVVLRCSCGSWFALATKTNLYPPGG